VIGGDPWAVPSTTEAAVPGQSVRAPAAGPGRDEDPWAAADHSFDGQEIMGKAHDNASGICYLLHFSEPYKHARHYQGFAESSRSLKSRLAEHEQGRGARLLQVVKQAGISWTLARTWPGTRTRERQLKNQGGASRRCPECGITPRPEKGERKDIAAMKPQPGDELLQPHAAAPAGPSGRSWTRAQLAAQIQHTGPALSSDGPARRAVRGPDQQRETELEAEP
jgi:hypothetical protein